MPEFFDTPRFRELIAELTSRYEAVVIDTPPALLASDSQVLAKSVDSVAAVVSAGSDMRGMADRMLRQLSAQHTNVLGVVLNRVQSSAGGYFRKNYQAYYDYQGNGTGSASQASQTVSTS